MRRLEMTTVDTSRIPYYARGAASFGTIFSHPEEVLADEVMDAGSKRALLASWASDARAIEHAPMLRQLDSGAVVKIDDILSALRSLDAEDVALRRACRSRPKRSRSPLRLFARRTARKDPDDPDDPPPAAAARQIALEAA